ncbi:hypothetical protein K431DRAFT_37008 [Polychaeton citri CBS 116435]|uniref:Uncharacterized protein n=1 Tax=Polychaeton citri CBS 116435 TaxID=1314669 RepID=A0A9P4QC19_9PEZI|nr:hypothetical protein K431DRAFT_37008 [Polychaeton citri CBS 116435]
MPDISVPLSATLLPCCPAIGRIHVLPGHDSHRTTPASRLWLCIDRGHTRDYLRYHPLGLPGLRLKQRPDVLGILRRTPIARIHCYPHPSLRISRTCTAQSWSGGSVCVCVSVSVSVCALQREFFTLSSTLVPPAHRISGNQANRMQEKMLDSTIFPCSCVDGSPTARLMRQRGEGESAVGHMQAASYTIPFGVTKEESCAGPVAHSPPSSRCEAFWPAWTTG